MTRPYMQEALELARLGSGRTSPNPAVGAVVVRDGQIVGRGYHTWAGVRHAEAIALEQAGEKARGATLYVTLEPCCHQGRTPPCAPAIAAAGVVAVVAAMQDPNPAVSGRGFGLLREAGVRVEVDSGSCAEAEELNQAFAHFMRTGKPLVTLKAALTLDGKIAAPEDNTGWITSETARAEVQQLRHLADAILTGIGTVLADDCLLTDRSGLERSRPLMRVVLDSLLRIPLDSKMVQSCGGDLLVATTSAAPAERRRALEARGVTVLPADGAGGRVELGAVVAWLAAQRYLSLIIEAGSKVNWAALDARIADKIHFFYAPKILGGLQSLPVAGGRGRRSRRDAIRLRGVKVHPIPPDEFSVEAWVAS